MKMNLAVFCVGLLAGCVGGEGEVGEHSMAIPNLLKSRQAANEASAVGVSIWVDCVVDACGEPDPTPELDAAWGDCILESCGLPEGSDSTNDMRAIATGWESRGTDI